MALKVKVSRRPIHRLLSLLHFHQELHLLLVYGKQSCHGVYWIALARIQLYLELL